jgi:hypothetical protein
MFALRLCCFTIALTLTASWGDRAGAVVIAAGDRTTNGTPPFEGPGWGNVTELSEGSAVYLGDRWMITANHVVAGITTSPSIVLDNRNFAVQPNTGRHLTNPAGSGLSQSADLFMFRLTEDPGIPGLSIVQNAPTFNTPVTMIGRGAFRDEALSGWALFPISSTAYQWIEVSVLNADVVGYKLNNDRGMRWGINRIGFDFENDNDNNVIVAGTGSNGDVFALVTTFNQGELGNEAQAVEGDSGGGVFTYTAEGWQLAGLMTSTKLLPSQPGRTVAFGDQSYITDLSRYRSQILSIMSVSAPWQNQVEQFDVNNDGTAAATDVLALINELNAGGSRALPHFPPTGSPKVPPYLDVNGDENFSALDVLTLINHLNSTPATSSLQLDPQNFIAGTPVPEPATWVLAIGGAIGLLAAHRRRRRA